MKNWYLPAVLLFFSLLSVLTLSSIAPSLAPKQLSFFLLGAGIFYATSKISFSKFVQLHWLIYSIVCILLGYVLLLGELTRNTARWISLGENFNLQPSQLAIPLVGITAATLLAKKGFGSTASLSTFIAVLALPAVLILVEPDLGSTVVLLVCLGSLLLLSTISWKVIGSLLSVALIGGCIAWLFVLQPYQKERIFSFTGQSSDYAGAGYNARQSLIAVGSGGFSGTGLGQGIQSHLRFLPERQTDFIFASFAEEFGLIGSSVVVLVYGSLIAFCFKIGYAAPTTQAKLYCIAIALMIAIQSGVNMAMNMGLVPITGVTLPLMSYGGSSLLTVAGSLGIVQSIARETVKKSTLHIS